MIGSFVDVSPRLPAGHDLPREAGLSMRVAGRRLLIVFSALLLASHVGAQAAVHRRRRGITGCRPEVVVAAAAESG
jgi:hypothetical protein